MGMIAELGISVLICFQGLSGLERLHYKDALVQLLPLCDVSVGNILTDDDI